MDAKNLVDRLVANGAGLFTGVPDSLLSKFSACVMLQPGLRHLVAANEGNAIGLAIGDYLSTGKPSVVYMQNSGLGNTVNPITSLADPLVYGIPMFLVIGWRGEPDVKDEPQHIKQGAVTLGQLDVLDIPYAILSNGDPSLDTVDSLWQTMLSRKGPVALVVRKDALAGDYPVLKKDNGSHLSREKAIELITGNFTENAVYVATTGKAGRELYEIRERQGEKQRDVLTVCGMVHASSIALGIALNQPDRWT
ncbi:MAG: thiamine pyrophosphate-binding protein, partial [Oxalobacter sp.]